MNAGDPLTLLPEALGFRWLRRSRAERQLQESAFFSTLLEGLTDGQGPTLVAEFATREDAQEFAAAWQLQPDGYEVLGRCTLDVVRALLRTRFDHAEIRTAEGRTLLEVEKPWEGVAVWLDDEEAQAWRRRLEDALTATHDHSRTSEERPLRAALYIVMANATWIVPSLLGVAAMMGLSQLGVSLLIAVPVGFILIAALILGPPVTIIRRALRRLI